MNKERIIKKLSEIFNLELTGVIRYTHYALMIFGANRLPLIDFYRQQAKESLVHADMIGEHITGLGGHPPLNTENTSVVAPPISTPTTDIFSESAIFFIISPTAPGVGMIGLSVHFINLL